jgi:hypothetical protein
MTVLELFVDKTPICTSAIALMMEAARTSETLVNFYQTARRYNPEDSHLHTHRRENFKSCCTFVICAQALELVEQSSRVYVIMEWSLWL